MQEFDTVLIFDTETTGLPKYHLPKSHPDQPRIVQLGAILADKDGNVLAELNVIVKPDGWTVPKEASDVHGISTEKAEKYGIPIIHALSLFNQLSKLAKAVAAHNISFDVGLLEGEFERIGKTSDFFSKPRVCTMKSSKPVCAIPGARGIKNPKLIEAHEKLLGVGFEGAHDAMEDVRACKRVYFHLSKANQIILEEVK